MRWLRLAWFWVRRGLVCLFGSEPAVHRELDRSHPFAALPGPDHIDPDYVHGKLIALAASAMPGDTMTITFPNGVVHHYVATEHGYMRVADELP